MDDVMEEVVSVYERVFRDRPDATFIGGNTIRFGKRQTQLIESLARDGRPTESEVHHDRIVKIGKLTLKKDILSRGFTGVVVAGFGAKDLFPSLVSYEIDGLICDRLKYIKRHFVDIDRGGPKAGVIPFAQKEMVERFLYGLDDSSRSHITSFCQRTVPNIRKEILNQLEMDETDRIQLESLATKAEAAFINGLRDNAFDKLREDSKAEIEDMVEFMPKPELATMAEALVNLTSLKRRVSRGMETVAGPIDVAVISQSEGFVWVKRKHYFPPEINARYFVRVKSQYRSKEEHDGTDAQSRPTGVVGRRKAPAPKRR